MERSTIHHPALLGQRGRFAREVSRIEKFARVPGLFDLPVASHGPDGHTLPEQSALRAFQMLGEAFGLAGDILRHAPKLAPFAAAFRASRPDARPDGLRSLRRMLIELGLTPAGWRWLVLNGEPFVDTATLLESALLDQSIRVANALGAVSPTFAPCVAFHAFVFDLVLEYRESDCNIQRKPWLMQAVWNECLAQDDDDEQQFFLLTTASHVARWVLDERREFDANQRRAGWPAIERVWRRETGHEPGPFVAWRVPFESVQCGEMFAVPIGNNFDLWREGQAMGHCIANYVAACVEGRFLALSVRGPGGQRVATMSFEHGERSQLAMCKGRFNQDVTDTRVLELLATVQLSLRA